ncbi:MAG: hypothetical protein AAFO07_10035 [Bacteroidota bacterium]
MYTSYIGKKFLSIYKERKKLPEDYSARQFFDEVLFPLFFDNEKFFMSVHSSPFDQLFAESGQKLKTHKKSNPDEVFVPLNKLRKHRLRKLKELHQKIEAGEVGGNTAVGFYSQDMKATTSGQITSMKNLVTKEEMYASWIGHGLSIRIEGGLILTDNDLVLWNIFCGWKYYREYLTKTPKIKDKQIEAWNGHWLCHSFENQFDLSDAWNEFHIKLNETKSTILKISPLNWIDIIFALARKIPGKSMTLYAYNLSKTNTNYGFIFLNLPEIKRPIELYNEFYSIPSRTRRKEPFIELYSTFYNFKNACMLGAIGLKAIEPERLREFMPKGTTQYSQDKDYKFTNIHLKQKKNEDIQTFNTRLLKAKRKYNSEIINYRIYKTWIIAMLNNKKELNALAEQIAQTLIDFEHQTESAGTGRGKSTQNRLTEELKSSKSLRDFIEKLTNLMAKYKEGAIVFKKVKDAAIVLPADLFPLFITLIRFEYQFKKSL